MNLILPNDTLRLGPKRLFTVIATIAAKDTEDHQPRIVVIERDIKNALPTVWKRLDVERWVTDKTLMAVDVAPPAAPAKPRNADVLRRDARWARIKDICKNPLLYDRSTRNALLKSHATDVGTTKETLLDDLRRFWLYGQNQDALLGSYWRCGLVDPAHPAAFTVKKKGEDGETLAIFASGVGTARGRKPSRDAGYDQPMAMPAELRAQILKVARPYFMADETRSIRATTDYVVRKMFAVRDEQGRLVYESPKKALLKPLGQRPTERQVRYLITKAFSASMLLRSRKSEADFDNNHASSLGNVRQDTFGAADVYEIDSTIIDLWLVSEIDRATIIGKATYYLVVDRATGVIVGFYITLENPSLEQAKQAIVSICTDWEQLCKLLGVEYVAAAFPAPGVMPSRFVADRAELLIRGSNVVVQGLGIAISNLPAKRGKKKPMVETGFKQTHVPIRDTADGYSSPQNAMKRQGKHYEKDACLTLRDLAKILLEIIMSHNLQSRTGKSISAKDAMQRNSQSRVALWERDIANRSGAPSRFSLNYVREQLWLLDEAVVDSEGVHFKGCTYTFDEIKKEDWLVIGGIKQFSVDVRHCPAVCNEIIIYDPKDPSRKYKGRLTDACAKEYKNLSFADVHVAESAKRLSKGRGSNDNQAYRVGLAESIEGISAPAHARMKKATKGKGVHARKANHIELRDKEKHSGRSASHALDGTATPYLPASQEPPSSVDCPAPSSAPLEAETVPETNGTAAANMMSDLLDLLEN